MRQGGSGLVRGPRPSEEGAARAAGCWGWGSRSQGWAGAGSAPTCAARPQAQVAKVAQAAGLPLRRSFSITTSPAQERADRGAAPRAAESRTGGGGAPSWPGRGALASASCTGCGCPSRTLQTLGPLRALRTMLPA